MKKRLDDRSNGILVESSSSSTDDALKAFLLRSASSNYSLSALGRLLTSPSEHQYQVLRWTTLLIPPTTLLIINLVRVVTGISNAIDSGFQSWGSLFGKLFFALWVILHLYRLVFDVALDCCCYYRPATVCAPLFTKFCNQ